MVVEYSLKAYLMLNKHKITKSHDLVEILNECISINHDVANFACADRQLLTQFQVGFVSPVVITEEISVQEAQEAIQKARNINIFVI